VPEAAGFAASKSVPYLFTWRYAAAVIREHL
jgi:hypothetical protein